MKNSQKGFIVSLLVGIIVVLLIAAGVYIYENKKTEAPISLTTETQSSSSTIQINSQNQSATLVSTTTWITGVDMDYPSDVTMTPAIQGSQEGPTFTFPATYFSGSSISSAKVMSESSCGNDMPDNNIVIEGVSFYKSENGLVYDLSSACNTTFQLVIATGTPSDINSAAYQNLKNIFYTMIDSLAKKLGTAATTQTSTVSPTALLQTYTNTQYGFGINYQSGVTTSIPADWAIAVPSEVGVPIVSIPVVNGTNGVGTGKINIGISTSSDNVATCLTPTSNEMQVFQNVGNVSINGITFLHLSSYSPAAGQFESTDSYHTVYNGACWDIDLDLGGIETNRLSGAELSAATSDYSQVQSELNADLQTFNFLSSHSIIGMSQYTDSGFGFSFWYPNGWQVTQVAVQNQNKYPGGTVLKQLNVTNGSRLITIEEFTSPTFSITDSTGVGACPVCSTTNYHFDNSIRTWMVAYPNGTPIGPSGPSAANVSNNTMGGLHMLYGSQRFEANVIVPLSAANFVIVTVDGAIATESNDAQALAKTIVALDPKVATPLGQAAQTQIIEAETNAYAGIAGTSQNPAPTITSIHPSVAAPGATVTVYGSNFGSGTSVSLESEYGTDIAATIISSTTLSFVIPSTTAPSSASRFPYVVVIQNANGFTWPGVSLTIN